MSYFWYDKKRFPLTNSNKENNMPPKSDHVAKMVAKAEEVILHCQEQLAADPPPDAATEAELLKTIDDQLAKVARLQAQQAQLEALKKAKK
jgi:hypothetical protein